MRIYLTDSYENLLKDTVNNITLLTHNDNNSLKLKSLTLLTLKSAKTVNVSCWFKGLKVVGLVGRGAYVGTSQLSHVRSVLRYVCLRSIISISSRLVTSIYVVLCQFCYSCRLPHVIALCTSGSVHVGRLSFRRTHLLHREINHPHPLNFTDQPYIHPTLTQTTFSTPIWDCPSSQYAQKAHNGT